MWMWTVKWKQMHGCHFGNKAGKLKTQTWPSWFEATLPKCFVQLRDTHQQVCGFCTSKNLSICSRNSFGIGVSSVAEHQERKYCYRSRSEEMGGWRLFQSSPCDLVGIQNPVVLANTDPCRMAPADSAQIQLPLLNFWMLKEGSALLSSHLLS